MQYLDTYSFATSMLSITINGKFKRSAVSIAPSLASGVIRHAIFLVNAISTPLESIHSLMTISPVCALVKNVSLPENPSIEKKSSFPYKTCHNDLMCGVKALPAI